MPGHGNSSETLTIPYEASLSYEKLSKNDKFYVITGKNDLLPEKDKTHSSTMLQQVWKIKNFSKTTDEIQREIKKSLTLNEYRIIFECNFKSCGGFEFRFNSNILNMPEMFVNLSDYKFLTAKAINYEKSNFISYIISVGKNTGYIQINQFGDEIEKNIKKEQSKTFLKSLSANFNDNRGSIILEGLKFKPGSADILESDLRILSDLANFLILNKKEKIILERNRTARN